MANQIRIKIINASNTQKAKRNVPSLFIAETPARGLATEPRRGGDVKRPAPLPSVSIAHFQQDFADCVSYQKPSLAEIPPPSGSAYSAFSAVNSGEK
jgi:hypothetical protein